MPTPPRRTVMNYGLHRPENGAPPYATFNFEGPQPPSLRAMQGCLTSMFVLKSADELGYRLTGAHELVDASDLLGAISTICATFNLARRGFS
ncbi:MAG TPA: hypothetical protein VJM46_01040 [Candidatus Saccharimonadales bacterium]|nr:hypothetical protein [Candidatus Saccharimonadales bacterium]